MKIQKPTILAKQRVNETTPDISKTINNNDNKVSINAVGKIKVTKYLLVLYTSLIATFLTM